MRILVRRKWRLTLGMIVFVVLATVMALPLVGLFFFRFYENQLIDQTESELIAQTVVLAAVYARDVESSPAARAALAPYPPLTADADIAADDYRQTASVGDYHPIEPTLDLTSDDILGRRPDAQTAAHPPDPAFAEVGRQVYAIALQTQDVTLAGFRILDPAGTIIAGRQEVGLSLAHVDEIAAALQGRYRSTLRLRQLESPPPPLYSVSRGTRVRVFVAMPVVVDQRVAGVIYASRTPSNIFKALYGERRKVALAALTIIGVTFLIGYVFSRTISRPIHDLIRQTRVVGSGDHGTIQPLKHYGTREIAMLSQSFLDMTERLSERAAYIRTFTAHVSHELKSPLTAIQGAAELLSESNTSASSMSSVQRQHFLDNILSDTKRLTALLERLRELARADNPQKQGYAALSSVVTALRKTFPMLDIVAHGDQERKFDMSFENATIAFSHLADNAARHGARRLRIEAESQGPFLIVAVADDGDGISENNRALIFDPFFTTRRESGGTGMGLGIVRSMLRSHGGSIELHPAVCGATFKIAIPLAPSSA